MIIRPRERIGPHKPQPGQDDSSLASFLGLERRSPLRFYLFFFRFRFFDPLRHGAVF